MPGESYRDGGMSLLAKPHGLAHRNLGADGAGARFHNLTSDEAKRPVAALNASMVNGAVFIFFLPQNSSLDGVFSLKRRKKGLRKVR